MGNSPWEKRILQCITISLGPAILWVVWCPCGSCSLRQGQVLVIINRHNPTMSLVEEKQRQSIPQAFRVGHCSSSSISPTLLVLRHLLQEQRAAVLYTFSTCWIWVLEYGLQMGAAYSSLGRTKVLYATSLVLLVAKDKFLWRKPKVLVALDEISEICWPQSMFSVIVIPRYFADWTFSKVCLCRVYSWIICLCE